MCDKHTDRKTLVLYLFVKMNLILFLDPVLDELVHHFHRNYVRLNLTTVVNFALFFSHYCDQSSLGKKLQSDLFKLIQEKVRYVNYFD